MGLSSWCGLRHPINLLAAPSSSFTDTVKMNSRAKGKRGELKWRDELIAHGYIARRGQQFSGGDDSPDVVCDDLPHLHFEVKYTQRLALEDAIAQAINDCGNKLPIVASYRTGGSLKQWIVSMPADAFFALTERTNNAREKETGGA